MSEVTNNQVYPIICWTPEIINKQLADIYSVYSTIKILLPLVMANERNIVVKAAQVKRRECSE